MIHLPATLRVLDDRRRTPHQAVERKRRSSGQKSVLPEESITAYLNDLVGDIINHY